ncbi:maltose alpha-D-glucosyltransferase [Mycolicibacterium monacense]|uniref:Trehalose synthase n=3 Tax=Mycobacteriaceae TaxID=1762 RepID=A0AAD1N1K5_MYCMB|nr:maltose alpha-D-glucosyltransferase [Mycolicibacterium monacense]MDA4101834.1 trehalose synthase [Mycolicibacterium monacense DSM 44395]OBB69210.1 trehalose synthase [Mycolicibacterium monacense]OBF50807.1 trehalose synthase [Mycolicibacterium monacense]ORB12054.1 trehalose synthase [Mycolicibacterium monacense DSM 44395]QHP84201.1 maltose alpha-D-glucosyltransferase [Mycolicibacterium monacense DSM 44395]
MSEAPETDYDDQAGSGTDDQTNEPSEITYDEYLHPARPRALRFRPRVKSPFTRRSVAQDGPARADNPAYVSWLLSQSMLADANEISQQFSGQGSMWQNPYATPSPRGAVETASVWFTAYPLSLITRPNESFLKALADDEMWKAFADIGIEAIHTGPVKRAGGISGWQTTPSVDGHFDRISTEIDPAFGTEEEFRKMCGTANWYGGTIIDDIVPGHTGKGADFRLAEMKYADYPGIYHMVEVDPRDWEHLPAVPPGVDSVNIDQATEEWLDKAGYIIGRLQRVIFYAEGIKETNWSVTRPVLGVDGVERRWVYLHYFKDGQPSINWLDPSFAGMRLVIGDALHSLADLGTGGLRLDANGFLGAEKTAAEDSTAWSEGHPLSEAANHLIASMVRKVGGFTFQELNLTIDDIRQIGEAGADLSYDFINRPAYQHALATADTEFLRLTLRTTLELGVDPASLIHALQNHDELTYELVHWSNGHRDDIYTYKGEEITGEALGETIRRDLSVRLTGENAPYNLVFTTNGIACTTATVIAATLGITDLDEIDDDPVRIDRIRRAHLLLAMFNALQPGVFALSGWDLCGMLTLPAGQVGELLRGGDTRWIHRAAHDLMGVNPGATQSLAGMPRGRSLYGSIPDQLDDETSFLRQLQAILRVRSHYGIATSRQVDIPEVSHRGMLVLVHQLADEGRYQLTVLNFANEEVAGTVRSEALPPGAEVSDMFTGHAFATVDDLHSFTVEMPAHHGMSLLVEVTADDSET